MAPYKRMGAYGDEAKTKALAAPEPDAKALAARERRDAEADSIHIAKIAAAEAFTEVRELIGDVKALRLAGKLRDSGQTAKNLATTAAILVDKSLLLEGRPTAITESRDADDLWRAIARQAGITESTAEPIPDAEVIEPPHADAE